PEHHACRSPVRNRAAFSSRMVRSRRRTTHDRSARGNGRAVFLSRSRSMLRVNARFSFLSVSLMAASVLSAACTTAGQASDRKEAPPAPVSVSPVEATERPLARFIRATGSLAAEDQAAVAAETAGRVVGTPVERGTPVSEGAELVRLSPTETDAQLKEAEANAAQIEARLGISGGGEFDVNAVPEVRNVKASYDLAQSEFTRIQS